MSSCGARSAALAVALLVGLAVPAPAQPATFRRAHLVKQISADPFAGFGGSQADTEAEPHIAVDPNDPSIVVAVVQQGKFGPPPPFGAAAAMGFATSHDGGRTWTTGSLPDLTAATGGALPRGGDVVVAFGPDGAVYAQTEVLDRTEDGTTATITRTAIAVQRSDDGGLTFGLPVLIHDDVSTVLLNDKPWITVDAFPGSPHHGRLYSAWDRLDTVAVEAPLWLRYSDDRGAHWSDLIRVSPPVAFEFTTGALPLVQPNGDLTIVYNHRFVSLLVAQTSHDGGNSFDAPVTIDTYKGRTVPGMATGNTDVDVAPAAAVDPISGKLFAAWPDARFNHDGLNDIVVSSSSNGGATWSSLGVVSETRRIGQRTHFFTPAVAAYDGAVMVTYVGRVEGEDRARMRYVVSTDDGTSFGRARRLGRAGDLDFAPVNSAGLTFLGDYFGLTLSANAAHAVWCRPSRPPAHSPFPLHQTTWSATILR